MKITLEEAIGLLFKETMTKKISWAMLSNASHLALQTELEGHTIVLSCLLDQEKITLSYRLCGEINKEEFDDVITVDNKKVFTDTLDLWHLSAKSAIEDALW